eukprot:102610_1
MSLLIWVVYRVNNQNRRIKIKFDSINDTVWTQLHNKIKKKWGKFGLKNKQHYSLLYETPPENDGTTYMDDIENYGDFVNAWETTQAKLIIIVEKEDPDLDEDLSTMAVVTPPKAEQKQVEEEKKQVEEKKDYEIKNPLVICIGISKYENFESELTTGCEIST